MKVLRQKTESGYSGFVRDYCCDQMFLMRGTFSFYSGCGYALANEVSGVTMDIHFCPFCGEGIEIIKESLNG